MTQLKLQIRKVGGGDVNQGGHLLEAIPYSISLTVTFAVIHGLNGIIQLYRATGWHECES